MRAAFNYYTSQLQFGQAYALTVDRAERSRFIRKYEELPDVTADVTSDLDLPDLYRNRVLTAMDDAKDELMYQMKMKTEELDLEELISLLREAQVACEKWFAFISQDDVEAALAAMEMQKA
jgi:hypothetical protein